MFADGVASNLAAEHTEARTHIEGEVGDWCVYVYASASLLPSLFLWFARLASKGLI